MYPHHIASIDNITAHFHRDAETLALLLGGSIAHGFETPGSDVDVMIVVSDAAHAERTARGDLHFFSRDLCTYDAGYVDGKYVARSFLARVAASGSEPARFAFQGARVLLSRIGDLAPRLGAIARYPVEDKAARIHRFYAQFEAWAWYAGEALRLDNAYLLGVSVSKLVLFGGRLILAHNEQLYPYHKWFLRVLDGVPDRPGDLMARIADLYASPSADHVKAFYETIVSFRTWNSGGASWPVQFVADSELNWLDGPPPIDDL